MIFALLNIYLGTRKYEFHRTQRRSRMVSLPRIFNLSRTDDSKHVYRILSMIPNTEYPDLTVYSTIISIRSLSFWMRVSQTIPSSFHSHMTVSYYVSRTILALPGPWMSDFRNTPNYAHSLDMWHQRRFDNVSCAWSWWLCGITPAISFVFGGALNEN